jgi:hypothetical protein
MRPRKNQGKPMRKPRFSALAARREILDESADGLDVERDRGLRRERRGAAQREAERGDFHVGNGPWAT